MRRTVTRTDVQTAVDRRHNLAVVMYALPCVCGYKIPNDDRDDSQCLSCAADDIFAILATLEEQ